MLDTEDEIISLYYGAGLTEQEAAVFADTLAAQLSGVEVELYPGGQPHYYFIISIE